MKSLASQLFFFCRLITNNTLAAVLFRVGTFLFCFFCYLDLVFIIIFDAAFLVTAVGKSTYVGHR